MSGIEWSEADNSLLLYLETCAVDLGGRVDLSKLSPLEFKRIQYLDSAGYLDFGRIHSSCHNRQGTSWVRLSPLAMQTVHRIREERAKRLWENRRFKLVDETERALEANSFGLFERKGAKVGN